MLNEQFALASLLLARGADPALVDKDGNTLLHLAARHHNKHVVDRLLELGVDVDAMNKEGGSGGQGRTVQACAPWRWRCATGARRPWTRS